MGTLARYMLEKRILFEICLTSNVHTIVMKNILRAGFAKAKE
jgi:adenosine deaminase